MNYLELSKEETDAIRRAEKCFRLAARAGTPEEAATANAMGNEIMLAYNINMAMIEEHGGDKGKRQEEKLIGGEYEFQRNLWREAAKLNFCIYMNITEAVKIPKWVKVKPPGIGFRRGYDTKRKRTHRMIGRLVNVRSATVMAQYLEETIDRLAREESERSKYHLYCKYMMSFREGIVDAVAEKIAERRRHLVDEETRKAEAEVARAAAAASGEVSLATAVTIASHFKSEHEANLDFLNPNRHVEKAERDKANREWLQSQAEAKRRANERYVAWAKAHPIEAALQEKEAKANAERERKREERNAKRRTGPRASYMTDKDHEARYGRAAGREVGRSVSIDRQTEGTGKRKALR